MILDIIMPEMDGIECFKHLNAFNSEIKVVLSTGYSRDRRLYVDHKAGVFGVIYKPYILSNLSRIVAQAIGDNHLDKKHGLLPINKAFYLCSFNYIYL